MEINPINNGIVIDHIEAGKGMEVYNFLNLAELDCTVALIKNVPSKKTAKKSRFFYNEFAFAIYISYKIVYNK